MMTARSNPTATPMRKPPKARSRDRNVAEITASRTVFSEPRTSGSPIAANMVHTCGMVMSEVFSGSGMTFPSALTSSHITMTRPTPASAQSNEIPPLRARRAKVRDRAAPTDTPSAEVCGSAIAVSVTGASLRCRYRCGLGGGVS